VAVFAVVAIVTAIAAMVVHALTQAVGQAHRVVALQLKTI
jgi:hypothetical protein